MARAIVTEPALILAECVAIVACVLLLFSGNILAAAGFALIAGFALAGWTPSATAFAALLAPFATAPSRILNARSGGPALVRALKLTARLHLVTGLVLAAGAALAT